MKQLMSMMMYVHYPGQTNMEEEFFCFAGHLLQLPYREDIINKESLFLDEDRSAVEYVFQPVSIDGSPAMFGFR